MIVFEVVRYKNFLSTGNYFNEIKLNEHKNTLVSGKNGEGKSTFIDAICFALFGRPYRNVNKPTVVNSINQKDCLVEIEFSIGTKKYKIRRGIKPNIFEIYVNGIILNQDSKAKDYQDILEKSIIKMNFKSCSQIVILGSASYVPFMQLSASDRRSVVEDLLDIQIFSTMATLIKEKLNTLKDDISEVKIRIDTIKEKIELHRNHIEQMKKSNDDVLAKKRSALNGYNGQLSELNEENIQLQTQIQHQMSSISDESKVDGKHRSLLSFKTKIEDKLRKIEKDKNFYGENDNCPTCKQEISVDFKESVIEERNKQIAQLNEGLKKLAQEKSELETRLNEISSVNSKINEINMTIVSNNVSIRHILENIQSLNEEIEGLSVSVLDDETTKRKSEELIEELSGMVDKRRKMVEDKQYYDVAIQLMKDGGIKTKIIKQYIPIINKLVNKYLSLMDFYVDFHMDDEFKESIRSRHRDIFSYENFSEGEKQKVDLAIMLTWRAVAKLKNSINTNLLILDETFDSSLDNQGADNLSNILNSMPKETNIFVISHRDQMRDKFNNVIVFEKKHNFSRIVTQ